MILADSQAVQVYHPYLLAIMSCIDGDDLLYKGDPGTY